MKKFLLCYLVLLLGTTAAMAQRYDRDDGMRRERMDRRDYRDDRYRDRDRMYRDGDRDRVYREREYEGPSGRRPNVGCVRVAGVMVCD